MFFRAATLPHAWTYLKSMAGRTASAPGRELTLASLVTPYHVLMFVPCAIVVWTAPQTWNFTQRLTAPKAAVCLALLCVSAVLMWAQAVNPFLYFQF